MEPSDAPAEDAAAAELALGLLDGAERAAALRRTLADPDFAADVAAWRTRLNVLFAEGAEATPPADAFSRISASLDAGSGSSPGLRRWRAAAVAATAVAAALLVLLSRIPDPVRPASSEIAAAPPRTPTLFLAVLAPNGDAPIAAVYDGDRAEVRLAGGAAATRGRSAQLWIIPVGGTPHPLGLLRQDAPTTLTIEPAARAWLTAGATLAISIEPSGGSPTGAPTGPIVATGALSRS